MRLSRWTHTIALTVAIVAVAGVAFAQGRGYGRGGSKGGGGSGEETTPNSLSVPAILVGGNPFGLVPDVVVAPEEAGIDPLAGFPLAPSEYFYVQGIHVWQASCLERDSAVVDAVWGDNLTGTAKLKTNSPIRVEIGLKEVAPDSYNLTGWVVDKLEPLKLDREAAYGTQAEGDPTIGFISKEVTPFDEVRVYDAAAWLRICNTDTPNDFVVDEEAKAEINSTGRIVYGYNLRVATEGTYVLEFTAPSVTILDAIPGELDGQTARLEITVVGGGGKGGGGKGKPE